MPSNELAVTSEEEEAWKDLERQQMNTQTEQKKPVACGCGRSPTGNCCGWHNLTEDVYNQRRELYETGKVDLQGREVK